MYTLFFILFLLSVLALIVGLVKPGIVLRKFPVAQKNRLHVLMIFGAAALLFMILIGVTAPPAEESTDSSEQVEQKSEEAGAAKAKAEEEAKAKEEAEAKAKAEEEAKAKEEAEAKAKAEEEAKAKEEAEAKAKAEEEAKAKAEEEKEAAQKTETQFSGYKLIEVDGGDTSGYRQAKVVVDIGFGDREYWAFTNEYGQLVRVIADKIILQDDNSEPVNSSGRYYSDEAKVPGVESDSLDEGHIIADSLGGVSNAYNITPQNSTLNRHGDQAYMEKVIRDAGGATNFEAIITYPNTETQVPSHYQYTYTINGNEIVDSFDNVNPDEVNESLGLTESEPSSSTDSNANSSTDSSAGSSEGGDLSSVDADGNGIVTIKEAKDAGYSMPITSDHWLYQYMRDNDGDGMVGE
ncbi:DNA/RNA non-specific endonuclease [Peribacillus faecalis]|nr:DNA/RNA non-specific endonuclease [Peribacillus faecalis]